MGEGISYAEGTIYLAAILGLLGLWLLHQMQVRSGRIQAVDLFDRSLVRMYVYLVPDDSHICEVCARAHGRLFLSSWAHRKGFSPLEEKCRGTVPCPGFLIGLYGGWLEARDIVAQLQQRSKKAALQLSHDELCKLVRGQWKRSVSADTDRVNVHLLEALCFEKSDVDTAVSGYRFVVDHAKEERHLPFIVPAYLRLIATLLRMGRDEEASRTIEQFEHRFPASQHDASAPSLGQRKVLEEQKSLLWERQSLKVSA